MSKPHNYIRAGADHGEPDFYAEALDARDLGTPAARAVRKALLSFGRRAAARGRTRVKKNQRTESRWRAAARQCRRAARLL